MKKIYILSAIIGLSFLSAVAKTLPNGYISTSNPAIAVKLINYSPGYYSMQLLISVKNIGDEPLTNIFFTTDVSNSSNGYLSFDSNNPQIPTLAPGEEVLYLYAYVDYTACIISAQIIVHATTLTNTEITDLSGNQYNNIYTPIDPYYCDAPTVVYYIEPIITSQNGSYYDLNGNNVIDVGDTVYYDYFINNLAISSINYTGIIVDNNATIPNPNLSFTSSDSTSGIHYLTQADVNLGYVYNSATFYSQDLCSSQMPFTDYYSPCNGCPNPTNAYVVTKLTSQLPNQITGKVKFNANNDNCTTGFDFPNRFVSTTFGPDTYASYTNNTGDYHILIPNSGNYTTAANTNLGANFTSNPTSITTTSSGSGSVYNNTNFCISSANNLADLQVNMFNINQAIPGFNATYRIYYANRGTTNLSGSIVLTFPDTKITLGNAIPVQNSATTNSLTWNYINLLPFESRYIDLNFNVLAPPINMAGDLLNFNVTGNPTVGDINIIDNTFNWNQIIRSSFDPNDKTVIEGAIITPNQATGFLNYVTRFQNSGTANATTVVVKETLDPDLDWSTFQPIDASHNYNVHIKNGNDLTYTFSNIDLPFLTANEPASHGWLSYRIKPKNTFAVGDIANSKSDIYFDYNPPIITNTVSTELSVLSTSIFIKDNFLIYPNPAANFISIENKLNIDSQYEIADVNGKILQKENVQNSKQIDISKLEVGFYFITIKTNDERSIYKFIKN